MVHVGMGKQHEIDARHIVRVNCRGDETFAADRGDSDLRTDAIEQDWVCENMDAVKIEKDGGVTDPANVDCFIGPPA